MSRYQSYQLVDAVDDAPGNFITIDTTTETPPAIYVAGPFDVTDTEHSAIVAGAELVVNDSTNKLVIIPVGAA